MATLSLKVNGKLVEKTLATLEMLHGIMTTANPAAKGVVNSVQKAIAKNAGYVDAFRKAGNLADVFVILENESPAAEYTRSQLAEKMLVSANVEKWAGKIFTEKSEKTPTNKGEIEIL